VYIVVFVCSNCGLELFRHVSSSIRFDPKRVVKLFGGRCPRCGRKLEILGDRLKFSTVKEFKSASVSSDNSTTVTFKVSPYLNRIIEEVASRRGYASKSDFIRDAIMSYLLEG
jgi:DNA-directed RNA polymerase subunit RPC12/RpoP